MQITGSNYSSYTHTTKNAAPAAGSAEKPQPDFAKLADYDSRDNTIFQNLLKNFSVQDNVVLNEDGTYSFVAGQGAQTEEEGVMRALIAEQNGDFYQSGQTAPFAIKELMMFRQATGYNLLQAGGGYMVVDDYGRPVPSDNRATVEAAWQLFDTAKGIQETADPGGSITFEGLQAVGEMLRDQIGVDGRVYQRLLDILTALKTQLAENSPETDALFGEG